MDTLSASVVPRLRGALHAAALVALVPMAVTLFAVAGTGTHRVGVLFFVLGLAAMFGVSALYHRGRWAPGPKSLLQRLDHSTIFLAISGTYTAVAVLVLHGWQLPTLLAVVWGGTLVGTVLQWLPKPPSRALSAALYAIVGWAALLVLPQLFDGLGPLAFSFILAGGVAYTVGAIVYATKRPDPYPVTFGFHEVFHTCTLVGAAFHFTAILMTLR
jgi:hemolysin III